MDNHFLESVQSYDIFHFVLFCFVKIMSTVKVNVLNILHNWDQAASEEFDFDAQDKGSVQKVNQFSITIQSVDTKQTLVQKVSLHLFDLLVNDEKNWQNGKRCRFCFNTTVELDEDQGFLECSSCKRIYAYEKRLDAIPFPHSKYIYLKQGLDPVLYSNTSQFQDPLEFAKSFRYDQLNKFNTFFDQAADIIRLDDELQVSSLLHEKITFNEVDCILFYDFYELMEKTSILPSIKENYAKLFWVEADYQEFHQKIKNSKTRDTPNFTKDNNTFKHLSKELNSREKLTTEYEKLPMEVFTSLTKNFNSVVLKAYFEKESFMNMLYVFHTIQLDESLPYVSYYVEDLGKLKHKIWRPLAGSDIQDKWESNIIHKKSLRFKIKYNDMYFTMKLFDNNNITITLPIVGNILVDKSILSDIVELVNVVLRKIQRLPYQHKLSNEVLQELDTNVIKWGTEQSNVVFSSLNMNNVIEFDLIDMQRMGYLIECLRNYAIIDHIGENKISFFYIYDVEDKESIRYEKFLRNAIQKRIYQFNNVLINNLEVLDTIKLDFGTFFELEETHTNFLFNKWIEENKHILGNIKEGIRNKKLRWNMLNGIYIMLEYTDNNLYKFRINGIKKWEQENNIFSFVRQLFYLTQNIKKYPFFKDICRLDANKSSILQSKNVNLKQALKKHLPNLFWDASKQSEKGYARKCQKKEQPLIFTTEQGYLSWLDKQQPKNKTNLQKIFTRGCPEFNEKQMIERIKELGHVPEKGRPELCLQFQMVEFQNKDRLDREGNAWTVKELKEINDSLNLPVVNARDKLIRTIERYFTIEDFKLKEGIEDVMPNPHTFIVKQDDNQFYITCPNDLNNSKSKNSKFMGFLDIDDHPSASNAVGNNKRKFCVPCCKERINESRTDFCSSLIDYEDYLSGLTSQGNVDYIKNYNKFPLAPERYGHLHPKLFQLFNQHPTKPDKLLKKVNRLALIQRAGLFLRIGVMQTNFSFVSAILSALNLNEPMTLQQALKHMKNSLTEDLFKSLNSGNLYWKYNGDIEQYKRILDIDNLNEIDIQDVWDLISREKVLAKYGINVIVFEIQKKTVGSIEVDELHLICPQDQEIDHFFKLSRSTIFLFKGDDEEYEPIINYLTTNDRVSQFAFIRENLITLANWYRETCSLTGIDASMTAKSLITKHKVVKQLIDSFNKVQYLVAENNYLIPTLPSGFVLEIPRESSKNVKKYMKPFESTLEFLKQNNFKPEKVLVKDNMIKAIIVNNDRLVPVILEDYKDQLPREEDSVVLDMQNVDEAILTDLPKQSYATVKKQIFREEAYQRFRLEFSHYISSNNIPKTKVLPSFDSIIAEFTKELSLVENVNSDVYERQNLREVCRKTIDNLHCDNGKLVVLKKDVQSFTAKLKDELERFPTKATEIYNKRMNVIIDPLLFLNDQKHVFF